MVAAGFVLPQDTVQFSYVISDSICLFCMFFVRVKVFCC